MKNLTTITMLLVLAMALSPVLAASATVDDRVAEILSARLDLDAVSLEMKSSEDQDEFINKADALVELHEQLAEYLVQNPELLPEFREIYASLDAPVRSLLDPVVDLLMEAAAVRAINNGPENYPGYGYPTPGYRYRRGRELERETLSVFWQKENETIETSQTVSTEMELSIAAGWGEQNTANGNIENFSIGQTSNVNINGSMKTVAKVTFTTRSVMIAQRTIKYQRTRVWHELWRAETKWFGLSIGDWELCGKTYEIVQEETGEEVIETPPTFM